MSWRDNLLQASFKNINFYITTHTLSAGVNVANESENDFVDTIKEPEIVEHPQGQRLISVSTKKRKYDITAYIIGIDYHIEKDRLIRALNDQESGLLKHPFLGLLFVKAVDWSVTESYDTGGVANFQISFIDDLDLKTKAVEKIAPKNFIQLQIAKILKLNREKTLNIPLPSPKQIIVAKNKLKKIIVDDRIDDIRDFRSMISFVDDYYDAINTISTISTMTNVAKDIFYNNIISPYHKIKAVIQSIFVASNNISQFKSKAESKAVKDDIVSAVASATEVIDDQEIHRELQNLKAGFIEYMYTAPAPVITEKLIDNSLDWLNILYQEKQTIDNEVGFRYLNSTQLNPIFMTRSVFFSES